MRILVLGGSGQLGRALLPALADHEVLAPPRGRLDLLDAAGVAQALDAFRPHRVVNAAAWTDVDGAEDHPEAAAQANEIGPALLARATAERGIPLLHVSTDYVFDGAAERPYTEEAEPAPLQVYGRTKLAGERRVQEANPAHYIVRTAWLFTPGGRNFASTIPERASHGPLRVVDDQRGSPTFAPHLAAALAKLLLTEAYGVHHLAGTGPGMSWYELARALLAQLGQRARVEPISGREAARPARRPAYSVLGTTRTHGIALPPAEEGIRAFAELLSGRRARPG